MTIQQRAILHTVGILLAMLAGSVAVTLLLDLLSAAQIVNTLAVISIVFLIYAMYGVILSRLEYQETLKKIVDKR